MSLFNRRLKISRIDLSATSSKHASEASCTVLRDTLKFLLAIHDKPASQQHRVIFHRRFITASVWHLSLDTFYHPWMELCGNYPSLTSWQPEYTSIVTFLRIIYTCYSVCTGNVQHFYRIINLRVRLPTIAMTSIILRYIGHSWRNHGGSVHAGYPAHRQLKRDWYNVYHYDPGPHHWLWFAWDPAYHLGMYPVHWNTDTQQISSQRASSPSFFHAGMKSVK